MAVSVDCAEAHALEHRVGAEAAGQLADALDGRVATLADDVGRAELPGQRDAVRVAPEQDDLLGAEPPGGDDAAEPDRAVADDGDGLARPDLRRERRVVARPHTSESVSSDGINAWSRPTGSATSVPSACGTRTASPWPPSSRCRPTSRRAGTTSAAPAAEDAGAVGPRERGDDQIAGLDRPDVGADGLDQADELVAHPVAVVAGRHLCTATNRCRRCRRG